MPKLFLVEIGFEDNKKTLLMVEEDLDAIENRAREENSGQNIEWIDIVEVQQVDNHKIMLTKD